MENLNQLTSQNTIQQQHINIETLIHGELVEGSKNLEAITVYTSKISYIVI